LNRDVWKDPEFAIKIKDCCVLYEYEKTTASAERFINLYHIKTFPCVCIVDPDTGRKEKDFDVPQSVDKLETLKQQIIDFLDNPNLHQNPKSTPLQQPTTSLEPDLSNEDDLQRALQMSMNDSKNDEIEKTKY